jgi:hypothetical protein
MTLKKFFMPYLSDLMYLDKGLGLRNYAKLAISCKKKVKTNQSKGEVILLVYSGTNSTWRFLILEYPNKIVGK